MALTEYQKHETKTKQTKLIHYLETISKAVPLSLAKGWPRLPSRRIVSLPPLILPSP